MKDLDLKTREKTCVHAASCCISLLLLYGMPAKNSKQEFAAYTASTVLGSEVLTELISEGLKIFSGKHGFNKTLPAL